MNVLFIHSFIHSSAIHHSCSHFLSIHGGSAYVKLRVWNYAGKLEKGFVFLKIISTEGIEFPLFSLSMADLLPTLVTP